jgi:hypothetical protein
MSDWSAAVHCLTHFLRCVSYTNPGLQMGVHASLLGSL